MFHGPVIGVTRANGLLATLAFGLATALITWDPVAPLTPGLDSSWGIGLQMAAGSGLDSGTQVISTYGPLGFLDVPSVAGSVTAVAGGLYRLLLPAALAASFLWSARRSFPLVVAVALAFGATAITPVAIAPLSLAAVWCLVAMDRDAPPWSAQLIAIGGGALAGVEILVKVNVGLAVLAMVAITSLVVGTPRWRGILTAAGAFALVGGALWFASGQGVGNIDDYVRASFEIASGYSQAMQLDGTHFAADVPIALVIGLGTLAFALYTTRSEPTVRRVGVGAVVGLLLYALLKQGFVRHDYGHVDLFIGGIVAPWLALQVRDAGRILCAAAIVVIGLAALPLAHHARNSFEPRLAVEQLADLLVPSQREDAREQSRLAMQLAYQLDPAIVRRIGDEPVDVRPWETGLVWAYGLNWRPLPVTQDYEAYTPYLDERNAAALAADDGPRYVLRHLATGDGRVGLDGRFTSFDAPAETRTLLCDFHPVVTTASYELLERGPDRCGAPRPVAEMTVDYGEAIHVPRARPGEAMFARIDGAGASGVEALRTLALSAASRFIELDGTSYRLTALTAPDGLLLDAPAGADFPAPFALAPNARTITVRSDGGVATSSGPLRISFEAREVAPLPPDGGVDPL